MTTDEASETAASELERLRQLERRNAELELLYETIRDLTSTLSVREVLRRLLGRALVHLEAEIGSILLLGPDSRLRICVAQGLPPEVVDSSHVRFGESISGYVAKTGRSLLVPDVEKDDRFQRLNHERYYTASFISAPLLHMGAARGVVNINNKISRSSFQQEDLVLLEALAGHASAALANARRYEELLEQAQRDSLTGLANHATMWSTLEKEFGRADRHERVLSLVMIDIDHFKQFNDQYGHLAGDEAICAVARAIESSSRAHDTIARYGGEEFVAILPETDLEGASTYAEKLRGSVEATRVGPGGDARLTISAGVASVRIGMAFARDLVAEADALLYRAKESGRNRVCSANA